MEKLTLKEKLELFQISKKPQKAIRVKLQAISADLNLPQIQTKQSAAYERSFKFNDDTKSIKYFGTVNKNKLIDRKQSILSFLGCDKNKENNSEGKIKKSKQKKNKYILNRPLQKKNNKNKDKFQQIHNQLSHNCGTQCQSLSKFQRQQPSYSYSTSKLSTKLSLNDNRNERELIRLKNELQGIQNLNEMYSAQLLNGQKLQTVSQNVAQISQKMIRNEQNRQLQVLSQEDLKNYLLSQL